MPKPEEDKETCLYCSHCRVCAIFIGVQSLFNKCEKNPPIDSVNLYKICDVKELIMIKASTNGIQIKYLTT